MKKQQGAAETLFENRRKSSEATVAERSDQTLYEGESGSVKTYLGTFETFGDYRVVEHLPSYGAESDIHVIERNGDRRILKLYRIGIEPKFEVLEKIEALSKNNPKDMVRIFETGFDEKSKRWYEIQEIAPFGSLKNYLTKNKAKCITRASALFNTVVREISASLIVLHDNGLLHLDLKPGNVLIRSEYPLDLVLTDFGVASILDPELSKKFTSSRGTPMYQSPESAVGSMGKASDWWGLGMIALEIALGEHPFQGLNSQVIHTILATKPVEIPESLPEDCKLLLRGLLTRDMKKRWGAEEVTRWLSGKRDIPEYYERALKDVAREVIMKPLDFMGVECHDLHELAIACAKNEESWNKGKGLLLRGNIRMWLEGRGEYEQALDLDALIEKVKDAEEKMFLFIHTYGKSLPLVFMGKPLTLNNIYLFLGKYAKKENLGEAETKIVTNLLNGNLLCFLELYSKLNKEENLSEMFAVVKFLAGNTPADAFQLLTVLVRRDKYFLPFLGDRPSLDRVLKALIDMKKIPWTKKRWKSFSEKYICPKSVIANLNLSSEQYTSTLSNIEDLEQNKLFFSWAFVTGEERTKLCEGTFENYKEMALKFFWGYDKEIINVIFYLSNKLVSKSYKGNDSLVVAQSNLLRIYITPFIEKKVSITQSDRNLLLSLYNKFINKDKAGMVVPMETVISRIPSNSHNDKLIKTYVEIKKERFAREKKENQRDNNKNQNKAVQVQSKKKSQNNDFEKNKKEARRKKEDQSIPWTAIILMICVCLVLIFWNVIELFIGLVGLAALVSVFFSPGVGAVVLILGIMAFLNGL
ncbi:MAG: protein kinase [Dethiosulfovibrio sp.]|nr:protein kinase [Dethiosulfovibrio sp.]